ncbi:unnamed protein product [Caenorhabditis angaria]|uniref:Uncharacterized protein n=1 Tax=Caenorhabditis angaria TaxID=860376 RepID=A0A9P1IE77_9PELO|nr:unnamed protein product [Caenorhabditis angaria]
MAMENECSSGSTGGLWPMPFQPTEQQQQQQTEEERIREVLRELKSRKEGGDVKEDIERIERILRDPLFKQLSCQQPISPPKKSTPPSATTSTNSAETASPQDPDFSIRLKNRFLAENPDFELKSNQKLHFGVLEAKLVKETQILETKEKKSRLLIVGPKDIKTSTKNWSETGFLAFIPGFPGETRFSASNYSFRPDLRAENAGIAENQEL